MSDVRVDPDVLERVARLLYDAIPAMYRVPDETGPAEGAATSRELRRLVEVLAGPLAVVRQSIEDLHADLFIDTADDRIVPYLAEMVGTTLVFPDALANRRDVRGTVAWRRRKGTPSALEEMGGELTAQPVVLQEGWKRIQLAQDLNLLRLERVAVDVRPAVVAEQASGPLDALFHSVDMRPITAQSGGRHPRHVTQWLSTTVTFPLRGATAASRSVAGSDVRFAFDPLGGRHALRAARPANDRRPFVDRIREQHFAADAARWFGDGGGFTIRVCGLPAGIAGTPAGTDREPARDPADPQVARGDVAITALSLPGRGWRGPVRLELGLSTVTGAGPDWTPNPATFAARASLDVDASGVLASATAGGAGPGGTRVVVLRLTALDGAPARHFPGATLELASAAPGSQAATGSSQLAREGFLAGVLHVAIPPLEIRGERLLHVAVDGSLYDAHDGEAIRPMPHDAEDERRLDPAALLTAGPGPAWPALPLQATPRYLNRVPGAPGCGPAVLHGAQPLRRTAGGPEPIPAGASCALAFAVALERPGGADYRPFQRLEWTGEDPSAATWTALDETGDPVPAADVAAELAAVARLREADPARAALAVRFECSVAGATLCPGEIAWLTDDGEPVLIHLPQLDAEAPEASWPATAPYTRASEPVRVAEDGSTWAAASTANRRMSAGAVAPIREAAGLRRRRVRWRRLCGWESEDWDASPPETLEPTERGRLDVDVEHGLFAFSQDEPPQLWPDAAVPAVTTDRREGATMHLGARPSAREPELGIRLPRPTRLVSRSGTLHSDVPADWHDIPRYPSLTAAFAAVSSAWQDLEPDDLPGLGAGDPILLSEVVQFEDSATYPDEAPVWPRAPSSGTVRAGTALSLTIQAAERERPVVVIDPAGDWTVPGTAPEYAAITLRGIAFGGAGWNGMALPRADDIALEFCTVLDAGNGLRFAANPEGSLATVIRCETAALVFQGAGELRVADSIVDADGDTALRAPAGMVQLDRVSVRGVVRVRAIEASEVIFDGRVEVEDRFRGCVRFSRVTSDSALPRVHRISVGTPVRVVSRNRRDPAWWRLREDCDPAISRGAENGSEMGAFSQTMLGQRLGSFERRLAEYTPAGLVAAIARID